MAHENMRFFVTAKMLSKEFTQQRTYLPKKKKFSQFFIFAKIEKYILISTREVVLVIQDDYRGMGKPVLYMSVK
jgi:hypothetical protein